MAPYFMNNLVPRRDRTGDRRPFFEVVRTVTWLQWAQFFSGWLSWTCDALDFFSVSLSVTTLGKVFDKEPHDITTAITLTLLFRSLGAVVFGMISDRFGRKWPLVVNLILCAVLQLGAGFVNTFREFLAVRALFGIAMGGIWGLSVSTALENLPVELRGLASGVIQEGYAVGYLLAAVINLFLVPTVSAGWRSLFWTAAGISLFAAGVRAVLPESAVFLKAKALEREAGTTTGKKTRVFIRETKTMLKQHWLLCIYSVILMSGFNFLSHGSQDLYPTYLTASKGFTTHNATVATIIGNCGAIAGGAIAGFTSQYLGRRLTMLIFIVLVAVFIPLWIIPNTFSALAAGAFCIQVGVQGAWGIIPIQLSEMSPPAFRATFPGVAYQLGNMVSSASSQIIATGGDNLKTTLTLNGKTTIVPDYAKVQGIFLGVVAASLFFIVILAPENHGSHFEQNKTAFEEGGGAGELMDDGAVAHHHGHEKGADSPPDSIREDEKRSETA